MTIYDHPWPSHDHHMTVHDHHMTIHDHHMTIISCSFLELGGRLWGDHCQSPGHAGKDTVWEQWPLSAAGWRREQGGLLVKVQEHTGGPARGNAFWTAERKQRKCALHINNICVIQHLHKRRPTKNTSLPPFLPPSLHSFLPPFPSLPSFLFPPQAKLDAQSRLKQLQADIAQLQDSLEEEQESKSAVQKQLMTAKNDAASWKNKFENEATPRLEELEDSKWVVYSHVLPRMFGTCIELLRQMANLFVDFVF